MLTFLASGLISRVGDTRVEVGPPRWSRCPLGHRGFFILAAAYVCHTGEAVWIRLSAQRGRRAPKLANSKRNIISEWPPRFRDLEVDGVTPQIGVRLRHQFLNSLYEIFCLVDCLSVGWLHPNNVKTQCLKI